ncbi:TM0106 family RecB-like putative nuclease [uncultured Pseudokineococcus sp.]|uniref:TM0106 family RecB-like putative nuclease n=1 Tax=uncultured Pseudokineococcus sp. TaxID=1642928 RepID=UPI00260F7520|nr:TM0106 family RecB-like putative nuclease [uncultured Pseudokineococcus sp.]
MRVHDGAVLLSAGDVVEHLACTHRTVTALRAAHGVVPRQDDSSTAVSVRGTEHEREVKARLIADTPSHVDLSGPTRDLDAWRSLAMATVTHLRRQSDRGAIGAVVEQGAVLDEAGSVALVGRPDFLVLTESGWRVEDAKLARSVRPGALLQLALYRTALDRRGVPMHDDVRLHLGDGRHEDVPARSVDAWAQHAAERTTAFVRDLPARGGLAPDFVEPIAWCTECGSGTPCADQREQTDHLSLVAGLRRQQAAHLRAAGITTLDQLATSTTAVPRLSDATLAGLRRQAQLQALARRSTQDDPLVEVLPHPARLTAAELRPGLWLLPEPDDGDVFFDMEGDPLYVDGIGGARTHGLEYLFGAVHDDTFTAFWGVERRAEGTAFRDFVDWVERRRRTHPGLHIYHYAPYERTALARLAQTHGTRKEIVDAWLREGLLVDLYAAVRRGLRAGVPSYSLKKIEALYGVDHKSLGDKVSTAADSIDAFEQWLVSGEQSVLDEIEQYNRLDCESTRGLRDYLLRLRDEAVGDGRLVQPVVEPPLVVTDEADAADDAEPSAKDELRRRCSELATQLLDGADVAQVSEDPESEARRLLAGLLGYHADEERVAWQEVFRAAETAAADPDAVVEDSRLLGGLEVIGEDDGAWVVRAPLQEHRIGTGKVNVLAGGQLVFGSVRSVEETADGVELRLGVKDEQLARAGWTGGLPHPDALDSTSPVATDALVRSLVETAEGVLAYGPTAPSSRPAGRSLLLRRPRLDGAPLSPAQTDEDDVAHAVRLVRDGHVDVLAVQGPPGAGKSYLGSHLIAALVAGETPLKVGVTAGSHEIVLGLLRSVHALLPDTTTYHYDSQAPSGAKATEKWKRLCEDDCASPLRVTKRRDGWAEAQIVGGTAWAFSHDDAPELDVLVVDEAGQMGLADVLAAARRARVLVLLGDPQQLPKPQRATHPPGVGVSALEHLAGGHATMPPAVGLFLAATRRMHPDVTGYISDIAYDGRLTAHASTHGQRVLPLPGRREELSETGLRWMPVHHSGCSQSSAEETDAVLGVVRDLVGRRWIGPDGEQALEETDVLVVSPYNAQVARLRAALDAAGLRAVAAGTVDKFQGKEAAAVVYSTAASDGETAPRGAGFVADVHRVNVAISRARCLAVLVGSPRLLDARVTTTGSIRPLDVLCRLVARARQA